MYNQVISMYRVQQYDREILKLLNTIKELENDNELRKMSQYKDKFTDVWENTHQSIVSNKKKQKQAEMDLVEIAQHLEEIEDKIYSNKTTSKELNFLLKEKETLLEKGNNLETEIITLLEEIDVQENLHKENKEVLRDINKKLIELKSDIKKKISDIENEITLIKEKRESVFNALSSSYQKYYTNKNKSYKYQVVSIIDENKVCGGCHLKISNNMLKKALNKETVKCEGCGRYLVIM